MEKKVFDWIAEQNLFSQNDNVVVSFSGGADSMALFHFLFTHRQVWNLSLMAAHFEHGIRGEESLQDARFAQEVCQKYGVELVVGEGNMSHAPKPQSLGTEAWARQLRYQFLEEIAEARSAKVALGHTMSDNAETVLFHAIRGTGPRGLGGIPPKRGCFVRPILPLFRLEIEEYCAANNLSYVQDATNCDDTYSRNRLRNQVLPVLEQVHPGAARSLARMAGDMRELDLWLTRQAEELLQQAEKNSPSAGMGYRAEILSAAPAPVRLKLLSLLAGDSADRGALERAGNVLAGQCRAAQLPGGKTAYLRKGLFYIEEYPDGDDGIEYEIPLKPGRLLLPGGYEITVEIAANNVKFENYHQIGQNSLTFAADYDKIQDGVFRTRLAGDRFAPKGRGITKTIKKWMNEQGLAPKVRSTIPLLAKEATVFWIWDEGFCQHVQPDENTRRLVWIHCEEKKSRGGRHESAQ